MFTILITSHYELQFERFIKKCNHIFIRTLFIYLVNYQYSQIHIGKMNYDLFPVLLPFFEYKFQILTYIIMHLLY